MLQSIIRRGIDAGEFRDLPAEHVARLCVAPMIVIVIWRTTFAQFDEEPYDYQGLVATHFGSLVARPFHREQHMKWFSFALSLLLLASCAKKADDAWLGLRRRRQKR